MRVFDFVLLEEHGLELLNYVNGVLGAPKAVDRGLFGSIQSAIDRLDDLVAAGIPDADLEAVLNSLSSLVPSVVQSDQATLLVNSLCAKLQQPQLHGKESITYLPLRNLFYAMGDQPQPAASRHQYALLCCLLDIASRCDRSQYPNRMITLDETLQYLHRWQCNVNEKRHCLRMFHRALLNGPQGAAPAKVMFQLLSTYTTDVDAASADDDARECVRTAINDPDTYMFNHLFRLLPVQRLKGQPIYELLKVFDSGMLEDYLQFCQNHQTFMEDTMGLPHEAYMEKMRVLTTMSLCQRSTQMSRDELRRLLMIDDVDQLEQFIVRAVQTRMVQMEIDDAEDVVILRGSKPRCFDQSQWELLLRGLEKWERSLDALRRYFD